MKTFLLCSLIGMLSAGIYGTIDLTCDIRNGTLITYDESESSPSALQFAASSKGLITKTNVHIVRKEAKPVAPQTLASSFSDLSFESFSRGEPPAYYEAMLMESVGRPDSLQNTDVSAAISDTIVALNEKVKNDSLAKREERRFSMKLFSRGRPRPSIQPEVGVVEVDTTKAH